MKEELRKKNYIIQIKLHFRHHYNTKPMYVTLKEIEYIQMMTHGIKKEEKVLIIMVILDNLIQAQKEINISLSLRLIIIN